MQRRSLLAAAATAAATLVAGCTGAGADNPSDATTSEPTTDDAVDDTTDDTTEDTTTEDTTTDGGVGFPYTVDVEETADAPTANVSMDATVTENFSAESPAQLRVSFTNDADEAREFAFGSLVPWDTILGEQQDGDASLLLAPTESVIPDEPTDNCWQATDGVALPAVMRTETLDPDETVSATFHLLAAHDSDDCHPTGTYRFEDSNYLDDGWWFDVQVVAIVEN